MRLAPPPADFHSDQTDIAADNRTDRPRRARMNLTLLRVDCFVSIASFPIGICMSVCLRRLDISTFVSTYVTTYRLSVFVLSFRPSSRRACQPFPCPGGPFALSCPAPACSAEPPANLGTRRRDGRRHTRHGP